MKTCMNLQDIMVTRVSQREKDKCFMESFVFRIQKSKQNKQKNDFTETESRMVVTKHWARENGEKKLKGIKFQL